MLLQGFNVGWLRGKVLLVYNTSSLPLFLAPNTKTSLWKLSQEILSNSNTHWLRSIGDQTQQTNVMIHDTTRHDSWRREEMRFHITMIDWSNFKFQYSLIEIDRRSEATNVMVHDTTPPYWSCRQHSWLQGWDKMRFHIMMIIEFQIPILNEIDRRSETTNVMVHDTTRHHRIESQLSTPFVIDGEKSWDFTSRWLMELLCTLFSAVNNSTSEGE